MNTVILNKKKVCEGVKRYILLKNQIKENMLSESENIDVKSVSIEPNLIFYSFDYGYCLIIRKAENQLNGKDVWFVSMGIDDIKNCYESYLTLDKINMLISSNVSTKGKYHPTFLKAVLN